MEGHFPCESRVQLRIRLTIESTAFPNCFYATIVLGTLLNGRWCFSSTKGFRVAHRLLSVATHRGDEESPQRIRERTPQLSFSFMDSTEYVDESREMGLLDCKRQFIETHIGSMAKTNPCCLLKCCRIQIQRMVSVWLLRPLF
jgi:hypothetical protein